MGYALIWALLTDPVKLVAYRIFDSPANSAPQKKPLDLTRKAAPASS